MEVDALQEGIDSRFSGKAQSTMDSGKSLVALLRFAGVDSNNRRIIVRYSYEF